MCGIFNPIPTRNTLVASHKEVYKLEPRPYDQQESMFVNGRQFELALQISVSYIEKLVLVVCLFVSIGVTNSKHCVWK